MEEENKICMREWHDNFGNPYRSCGQCFVRDNAPFGLNPLLITKEQLDKNSKIVSLRQMRALGFKKPEVGEFILRGLYYHKVGNGPWKHCFLNEIDIVVVDDSYLDHGNGD